MTFKYDEGDVISLTMDYPAIGLHKGDEGVIWALYEIEPPHYEATFRFSDGSLLDMTVSEEEISAPPAETIFERTPGRPGKVA